MYLSSKNFKPEGMDLSKVEFISEEDFERYFRKTSKALTKPEPSDVLVGIIGSLGEPYVVRPSDRFGLSSSVAIIRPRRDVILPEYLYYWMKGSTFQRAVYGIKGGVAQSYLSLEMIRSLPLRFPSLIVQQRTVDILSAYDVMIENNTRRIKILEEMAQMIYREWFVNFRFPGDEKAKVKTINGRRVPDGWEVRNLFDLSEVTYGFPFKSKLFSEERMGIPVVRIRDIVSGSTGTLTTELADEKYLLRNGDLLVGMDGDFHMGKWSGGKAYLNQRVVRFRPKKNLSPYYLFLAIQAPINHFDSTIVGTTVAHLGDRDLRSIELLIPDHETLKRAESILNPCYELEINLALKNSNLRETRDLLLPRLISGEISVDQLETEPATQIS